MGLFKKTIPKAAPDPNYSVVQESFEYPVDLLVQGEYYENILHVIKDIDLNELHENGRTSFYLRCMVSPSDENPNGLFAFAGPKGTKSNMLTPVARIPSEDLKQITADNKKVAAGTHYWSIRATISVFYGMHLYLSLNESKFKR